MVSQAPHALIMVRPAAFGYNGQTAASNSFQFVPDIEAKEIHQLALQEFDRAVDELRSNDINIIVIDDVEDPVTPDAIFPNNWFSTHHNGELVLYPMEAKNRRFERRDDVIELLKENFAVSTINNLSKFENENKYLEGTGSIVFDHISEKAYACRSSRTNELLLMNLCESMNYTSVIFDAVDRQGNAIYHTNVMMCITSDFAIICIEAISEEDQEPVINHLQMDGKQLIAIGYEQMNAFAGNVLEVENSHGEKFLVMSESAFQSLVNGQINAITKSLDIINVSIPTIEQYGGGGIRCMIAGIHLPKK